MCSLALLKKSSIEVSHGTDFLNILKEETYETHEINIQRTAPKHIELTWYLTLGLTNTTIRELRVVLR